VLRCAIVDQPDARLVVASGKGPPAEMSRRERTAPSMRSPRRRDQPDHVRP
jgi:hypothetical protein